MAMQLGALRDALLDPGDVIKANAAAEEVTAYEGRFDAIDTRFNQVDGRFNQVDVRLEKISGELNLLRWMLASIFALLCAVALKLFIP